MQISGGCRRDTSLCISRALCMLLVCCFACDEWERVAYVLLFIFGARTGMVRCSEHERGLCSVFTCKEHERGLCSTLSRAPTSHSFMFMKSLFQTAVH
jgi:hypothetical protein